VIAHSGSAPFYFGWMAVLVLFMAGASVTPADSVFALMRGDPMMKILLATSLVFSVFVFILPASGDIIFWDDCDDGSAVDGSPGTWQGPPEITVENDSMVIRRAGSTSATLADADLQNLVVFPIIFAGIRAERGGVIASSVLAARPPEGGSHVFAISQRGSVGSIGGADARFGLNA